MSKARLETRIGTVLLKNPVIAGSAEHLIDAEGVRRAIKAGAGAVVVKSTNESQAARVQLQQAEYAVLDENWERIAWNESAPRNAFIACRSGLTPQPFDAWLEQTARLDHEASKDDAVVVASLILADLEHAVTMAKQIETAGLRVLELNIGTPYASQAAKGAVSTELDPARITNIVNAVRSVITIPLWIKITGQSERVPDLADAAFEAGGNAVVMAGRLLGMIPDIETHKPVLDTSLGVGGTWHLPLTCHWLALTRNKLGTEKPLIGTNGAQSGLDIARMMLAGASAVEMSSQVMLRGFSVLESAVAELGEYLNHKGLTACELVGKAADNRKSFAQMQERRDNWRNHIPQ
ncbi:dihydroorotate dehydrogenase [Brucella cytisi]|uniref:dihydrouracil dehydrogenase (NAD(+)) n=1 Tax=Brucella cytisi TaxID=407152 RepID=A0A1J6I1M5_9HYPH|nr:dihydroorotate dehydrogenase [Brucella cytisi]OIS92786.1 dihydroorotate dehydrogenase [Brucella cytisi]